MHHRKITIVMICICLILLTSCGNQTENKENKAADGSTNTVGMGRYVEDNITLPEEINRNGGLNMLADGSMTIISFNSGLYRSTDGGASWQQEETAYFPMMQGVYALAAVMAPDGTAAITCTGEMPQAAREKSARELPEDWEGNYCIFALPGGEIKVVDFGFSQEDGSCISTLCFKEDNRLFAGDMNGKIYEIDIERESLRELFMVEGEAGSIGFCGDILMAVGKDRLYLYDLGKDEFMQSDGVADQFIKNMLIKGTTHYTGGGYPLAVFGGEEGVIYIACVDGLYRHALGGSAMEQVIDGALSTFGDGTAIYYGRKLEENSGFVSGGADGGSGTSESPEFLVQFSRELIRYRFDRSIPAMPDKEIRIYSLEKNNSVRSAVTSYKKEHTDRYVRYEIGLDGEDGMTMEDTIKKLNSRILAGDGPDVLILDGLPVDSYIEKGMLADIGELLEESGLFPNLVESFRKEDGAVYTMPLCFQVPLLVGDTNVINEIENLESFADGITALRETNKEGGLLGIYDAGTMLQLFGMVSSPAWVNETDGIDRSAVEAFLMQTKRIYEAELAGALPEETETLQKEDEELTSYGIDPVENKMEACNNVIQLRRGYAKLACGYIDGIQICLDNITSVIKLEETISYKSFPGQKQGVFVPKVLAGISAKSTHRAEAEEFIKMMFSAEKQEEMYDGFPVNEAAFAVRFLLYLPGDSNGSMTFAKKDGTEEELELLWPNEAEQRTFTELVRTLQTPAGNREWLNELVYEAGLKVLEGNSSVEDAAKEIEKKASIYPAE